jgi:hypothetical protein
MSLTRKDIKDYKTTVDSSRKNRIEMSVIDDSFEREALEGWSDNQVLINQLKSLDRKLNFNLRFKLILSSSIATILISAIILLVLNSKESNKKKSGKDHISIITSNIIISKDSIKTFRELPKKLQIKPANIKTDFAEKQFLKETDISEPIEINRDPIHLPLKKLDKINTSKSKRENIAKETYLNDLKIIDYRNYRTRPNESIKNELSGTPANMEKNDNKTTNHESNLEYTYFSYLDKTLKHFSKNKFKTALNRFEVVLEKYPDDVNALFYSSICLYNLDQFELCKNRLIQLQNSQFTNFDQEQQWYLLLVYKSLGNMNSFELLKEKIILENGYYSKAAKVIRF